MFDQIIDVIQTPEFLIGLVVFVVLAALYKAWKGWDRPKFEANLKDVLPDEVEPFVMPIYDMAIGAVDQIADAYGNMDSEAKLELCQKIAVEMLKFFATRKLSTQANRGLIEYRLYVRNQQKPGDKIEAVPLQERAQDIQVITRLNNEPRDLGEATG